MTLLLTIARAAGFFGVLAIIVLSLVPSTYRPHTGLPGVAEHFIALCLPARMPVEGIPRCYRSRPHAVGGDDGGLAALGAWAIRR